MQIHKLIAAALRGRAAYQAGTNKMVADAIEPTNTEETILKIALGADDIRGILSELADYFDAPVQGTAQDPVAGMAINQVSEPTIRILDEGETIEAGDEWRLRDGLHHQNGRPVEWRQCGGSVGNLVSDYPDSIFRRH